MKINYPMNYKLSFKISKVYLMLLKGKTTFKFLFSRDSSILSQGKLKRINSSNKKLKYHWIKFFRAKETIIPIKKLTLKFKKLKLRLINI